MRLGVVLAVWCAACGGSTAPVVDAPPTAAYDVVVVGAGTGGTAAAIAAARHGATVLLVEPTGWIGGQMAPVPALEDTVAVGTPATALTGFVGRVRAALIAHYAATGRTVDLHRNGSTYAEPRVVRDVLVEELAAAGVTVQLHTDVTSVQREGDTVTGVTLTDGTIVTSHVVIDATEYGDLLPLSGAAYRVGNQTSTSGIDPAACIQAITYVAPIRKFAAGVPVDLAIATALPGYDAVPTGPYHVNPSYQTTLHSKFSAEVQASTTPWAAGVWTWAHHNRYRAVPDSAGAAYDGSVESAITRTSMNYANDYPPGISSTVVAGTLPVGYLEDRDARRTFECAAKLETLQFLYFVQHELGAEHGEAWSVADDGGFDAAGDPVDCADIPSELLPLVRQLPPTPYVRESRRIVAIHTLTGSEIARDATTTATTFHSSIARGYYPMDLHGCATPADFEPGTGDAAVPEAQRQAYGPIQIPFESMIPVAIDGLLPAEKNLGVSRLASGTTRMQGATMLTGEAAGVIAALAVMHGVQPRAVERFEVQRALVADGDALAMTDPTDVPATSAGWGAIELALTRGVMTELAPGTFAPAGALTRASGARAMALMFRIPTDPPPASSDFGDVAIADPDFRYIEAIFHAGLTAGCGGGNFCPASPLTRAQLATFLARGAQAPLPACSSAPFPDVLVTDPACPAISYVTVAGLMIGCGGGAFCPTTAVTRSEAAGTFVATMVAGHLPLD